MSDIVRYTADEIIAMDEAFVARMKRAIRKGRERAAFGIKIDRTPLRARVFHPAMIGSGCGSPAALCTESGDGEDRGLTYA
jgi:hypothetical protein